MSDKFVWTKADTSLLLSLWSDRSVQKNFEETPRNVAIWYGIARYMRKRGIDVNWLQCRQRMKRLVDRYRKIKSGAKLNLKNMTDSFFHELDLVFNQNLETDSILDSSSADVSNEATTAVESLLREPQFVNEEIDGQTLELKQCEITQDLIPPTPKIETSGNKPKTRPKPKPMGMANPRPASGIDSSEVCVSDVDPNELPSNIKLVKVVSETKGGGGQVLCNEDTKQLYGRPSMPLWYANVNSTDGDNPTRSGSKEMDPSCVVKQGITNESDTITKMLLAQAETTRRLLEANRTQQERLESRMDQIVGQLEQMVAASNQGITNKLETKLNSILNKLDKIIPHTNVETSEQTLYRKMEVVLERLEHIVPGIEQYSSSVGT